jgi:hypothetical protein
MNLMVNRFLDECSLTEKTSGSIINTIDWEIQEPSEETSMMLWVSNHPMPFNDANEVQEPPVEVLDVQTRGISQMVQTNPTTTQLSRGNQAIVRPKPLFPSQKNPTNIYTGRS